VLTVVIKQNTFKRNVVSKAVFTHIS